MRVKRHGSLACMPLSAEELEAYRAYLSSRGLVKGTQDKYCQHVRLAHQTSDLFDRLRSRSLSPKAKRLCKASLVSYAKFLKDQDLRDRLEDFRLPPPRRKKPKRIFSHEEWGLFRDEVRGIDSDSLRAVIGLMTFRGFRVGDALRLRRKQVASALSTGLLVHTAKGDKYLEFGVTSAYRPCLESLASHRGWDEAFELISPTQRTASNRVGSLVGRLGDSIGFRGAHPHLLRSTYATYFYVACGKDLVALQEHMQWSSLETARQYVVHHNREALDRIAEKMFYDPDD